MMIEHKETDERLELIVKNAITDLQEKLGSSKIDFCKNGASQTFFLNYCKYCYFGQEHSFFQSYQNEFLQLREIYGLEEDKNES